MDDLISRQAVIGAIVNKVSDIGLHDNSEVARYGATFRQHEIIDIIESLPSAHQEIEERKEESAQNVPKEDLISRKAAIDVVESSDTLDGYTDQQELIYRIRQLPSAQPEIVRCKDCENWIPGYITDNDDFIPPKCGKYQQMVGHSSDDYCSLAERRTDATDQR